MTTDHDANGTKNMQLICSQRQKVVGAMMVAWERELKLYVKPKPAWITAQLWSWMVNMVLIQTEERKS